MPAADLGPPSVGRCRKAKLSLSSPPPRVNGHWPQASARRLRPSALGAGCAMLVGHDHRPFLRRVYHRCQRGAGPALGGVCFLLFGLLLYSLGSRAFSSSLGQGARIGWGTGDEYHNAPPIGGACLARPCMR